jgi:acyl-CoA thioesterase
MRFTSEVMATARQRSHARSNMTDPASHPHPFDAALQLERAGEDVLRGTTSDLYWNMVGLLGGLVNAILVRAVLDDPRRAGTPIALTVNFCAAMSKGDYDVRTHLQRAGKITQHWSLELHQLGKVCVTASLVCAHRCSTWSHRPVQPPAASAPEALERMSEIGSSEWIKRFDFRFASGAPQQREPGGEPNTARSVVWVRHDPARALDSSMLAMLSDVFIVRIYHVRGYAVPLGTVSLTSYFHVGDAELDALGSDYVLGVADSNVFHDSFQDQSCQLWSRDGRLLVSGTQIAWYKE